MSRLDLQGQPVGIVTEEEQAQAEWPQWVAALTGKLGTRAGADGEAVIVLENPALQVFEKKAKPAA